MAIMHFKVGEPQKGGVIERVVDRLVRASQVADGFLISLPMANPSAPRQVIRSTKMLALGTPNSIPGQQERR